MFTLIYWDYFSLWTFSPHVQQQVVRSQPDLDRARFEWKTCRSLCVVWQFWLRIHRKRLERHELTTREIAICASMCRFCYRESSQSSHFPLERISNKKMLTLSSALIRQTSPILNLLDKSQLVHRVWFPPRLAVARYRRFLEQGFFLCCRPARSTWRPNQSSIHDLKIKIG